MSKLIVLVVLVAVLGSVMCQYIETDDQPDYIIGDRSQLLLQPILLTRGAFDGDYCVPPKVRVGDICVKKD
ncbi:hypothetical protein B5X24_HaOG202058 [Helicoverpa armigera]|uniref:Uncharacterized protein n=1 Tax=Helicoverpa armigera TaxID=29058 RepID=A0A2W1BBD3_HELAM|nr:hypothetical protein B5X24_HaOG202058 [Helicoverpa armigera]